MESIFNNIYSTNISFGIWKNYEHTNIILFGLFFILSAKLVLKNVKMYPFLLVLELGAGAALLQELRLRNTVFQTKYLLYWNFWCCIQSRVAYLTYNKLIKNKNLFLKSFKYNWEN